METVLCQICQNDISELSPSDRNIHVNQCMDNDNRTKPLSRDKNIHLNQCRDNDNKANPLSPANENKITSNSAHEVPLPDANAANKSTQNKCSVCGDDLSSLFESGRQLHINRCVDKKAKRSLRTERPKAKEIVLDCPLCGKPLKTLNSRKSHMKNCAKSLNVSTAVLVKRIQQQEAEHAQSRKSLSGLLTSVIESNTGSGSEARNAAKPQRPRRNKRNETDSTTRPTCVDRVFEEETEIALAVSNSLSTEHNNTEKMKNAYAVMMSSSKEAPLPKKSKRKQRVLDTPALVVETAEERELKLSRRIAKIVQQTSDDHCVDSPEKTTERRRINDASFQANCSADTTAKAARRLKLWRISCGNPDTVKVEDYYVSKITPPIRKPTKTNARKSFVTFDKSASISVPNITSEQDQTGDANNINQNESVAPGSQTANVLAQLAVNETVCYEDPSSQSSRGSVAVGSLLSCLSGLVNSQAGSDVCIHAADGQTVYAHSVIVTARCPALMQLCNDGIMDLKNESKETVVALLRYLYAADVVVDTHLVADLHALSSRLHLPELTAVCDEALTKHNTALNIFTTMASDGNTSTTPGDAQRLDQTADETLQTLLRQVWGSQDGDDTSSDSDSGDVSEGNRQSEFDAKERAITDDEYSSTLAELTQCSPVSECSVETSSDMPVTDQERSPSFTSCGLNMTLHERMTYALLQNSEADVESDRTGTCSETPDKDRTTNPEDGQQTGRTGDEATPIVESLPFCMTAETPRDDVMKPSLRNESATPDLFVDSPELVTPTFHSKCTDQSTSDIDHGCLKDSDIDHGCLKDIDIDHGCLKDSDIDHGCLKDSDIAAYDEPAEGDFNGQLQHDRELSDNVSTSRQGANSKSEDARSSTDDCSYESPVIQTQPSQGHRSPVTPFISQRRSKRARKSISVVKRLSEKFSMAMDSSVMSSPEIHTQRPTNKVFGNHALYNSSTKYSSRTPKKNVIDNSTSSITGDVSTATVGSPTRKGSQRRISKRLLKSFSSSPEIAVCKRIKRSTAAGDHSPLKVLQAVSDQLQCELQANEDLPSLEASSESAPFQPVDHSPFPYIATPDNDIDYSQFARRCSENDVEGTGDAGGGVESADAIDLTLDPSDDEQKSPQPQEESPVVEHQSVIAPKMNEHTSVWDDFDDDGYNDMAFRTYSSPLRNQENAVSKKDEHDYNNLSDLDLGSSFTGSQPLQEAKSDSQHSTEGVTSAVNNCIDKMFNNDDTNKDDINNDGHAQSVSLEDYDPPTDISLNVTTDAETSLQRPGRVTPLHTALTPPKVNKRKKAATPMPVYAELPTPEIMKQADKYGLRKFPKKRMIKLLKNIYEQTHPDPAATGDTSTATNSTDSTKPLSTITHDNTRPLSSISNDNTRPLSTISNDSTRPLSTISYDSNKPPSTISSVPKKKGKNLSASVSNNSDSDSIKPPKNRTAHRNRMIVSDSSELSGVDKHGENDTEASAETLLNTSMENSDCEEVLEESVLESCPSNKLSKRDLEYKRQQIWEFIRKNDDLLNKILLYEPLEFDEFHTQLKESGLAVGSNVVSDFLDDKCVPYTMRKLRQEKPSWQRKRKKTKPSAANSQL